MYSVDVPFSVVVITVTPVVTGISVHFSSMHDVTVTTVVYCSDFVLAVAVNEQYVVCSVTTPDSVVVTTVTPVVIGVSVHLFSEHEVTVMIVLDLPFDVIVEVVGLGVVVDTVG